MRFLHARAPWAPTETDARRLIDQLRSSRMTVLCGGTDAPMAQMLKAGVLPRLQRRADDRCKKPRTDSKALPPTERRLGLVGPAGATAEVSVFFDQWGDGAREALTSRLLEALRPRATTKLARGLPKRLGDQLTALNLRFGVRFMLVFDHFEACLLAPPESHDLRALRDEIFSAINHPKVPAQFLLTVREGDEPLLDRLRGRVRGFEAKRWPLAVEAAHAGGPWTLSSVPSTQAAPARAQPTQTLAVYASIEALLGRMVQHDEVPGDGPLAPNDAPVKADDLPVAPAQEAAAAPGLRDVAAGLAAASDRTDAAHHEAHHSALATVLRGAGGRRIHRIAADLVIHDPAIADPAIADLAIADLAVADLAIAGAPQQAAERTDAQAQDVLAEPASASSAAVAAALERADTLDARLLTEASLNNFLSELDDVIAEHRLPAASRSRPVGAALPDFDRWAAETWSKERASSSPAMPMEPAVFGLHGEDEADAAEPTSAEPGAGATVSRDVLPADAPVAALPTDTPAMTLRVEHPLESPLGTAFPERAATGAATTTIEPTGSAEPPGPDAVPAPEQDPHPPSTFLPALIEEPAAEPTAGERAPLSPMHVLRSRGGRAHGRRSLRAARRASEGLAAETAPTHEAPARSRFVTAAPWGAALLVVGLGLSAGLWSSHEREAMPVPIEANAQNVATASPMAVLPSEIDPPAAGLPPGVLSQPVIELSAPDPMAVLLAEQWARTLAANDGPALLVLGTRGWAEDLSSLRVAPRVAIARDDALRAARSDANFEPLQIVMPWFAEELLFVVRADSPLKYIHQIEGRRINAGAIRSPRALTVRTAYQRLFGVPPSADKLSALDETAALQELRDGSTDVVVLVGRWPETGHDAGDGGPALRLLKLDAQHPASRRALSSLLPARVSVGFDGRPAAQPVSTLAVMSFLVASAAPARATADDATAADLGGLVRSLCQQLPTLRREGDPKWRELRPDRQPEAAWPYAPQVRRALRECGGGPRTARPQASDVEGARPAAEPIAAGETPG